MSNIVSLKLLLFIIIILNFYLVQPLVCPKADSFLLLGR